MEHSICSPSSDSNELAQEEEADTTSNLIIQLEHGRVNDFPIAESKFSRKKERKPFHTRHTFEPRKS